MFPLLLSILAVAPCRPSQWQQRHAEFKHDRPAATAQDFYKLVHQGVMGSEHAVGTGDAARAWMQQELASLAPAPAGVMEPLLEPLPPDGRYVRVHLRPYVARGLSTDALVNAFIATANAGRGDTAMYVPHGNYILDYKGRICLLISGQAKTNQAIFDQYSVGNYGIEGKAGTYMDAEDGELSCNNVEHAGVDSVMRFSLNLQPSEIGRATCRERV